MAKFRCYACRSERVKGVDGLEVLGQVSVWDGEEYYVFVKCLDCGRVENRVEKVAVVW